MERLKALDTLRGISICWMIVGHLIGWWIIGEDFWISPLIFSYLDFLGSTAFILISGISMTIFFRTRMQKAQRFEYYSKKMARNDYLLRSTFIMIVALFYNLFVALFVGDFTQIWKWFVLFAIGVSLLMAYPCLHFPKFTRVLIAIISWLLYIILLDFLAPYEGTSNFYGVMFHFLYNSLDLDPILGFFPFLLLGTVIGDVIYEINQPNQLEILRLKKLKKELLIPMLIIGPVLIIFGILFEINLDVYYGHTFSEPYPDFLLRGSFPWMVYSLGVFLVILSVFIIIEDFNLIKTKKDHKFFYYFSYYSLSIYLVHNLLFFLFLDQLNVISIWFVLIITIFITFLVLKFIHNQWGAAFSIKSQLGRLSVGIASLIEERQIFHHQWEKELWQMRKMTKKVS